MNRIQANIDNYARGKGRETGKKMFDEKLNLEGILMQGQDLNGADIAEILRRTVATRNRQKRVTRIEPQPVSAEEIINQINRYEKTKKARGAVESNFSFYS